MPPRPTQLCSPASGWISGLRPLFVVLQFVARCWGDGTEESCEARVWRRNTKLLLWGGLHLREHRERAVLLHVTGQCQRARTHTHTHTQVNMLSRHYLNSPPPPSPRLLQERQSIIKYWMDNLRAKHGEVLHNINFLEGQPISKLHPLSAQRRETLWYLSL